MINGKDQEIITINKTGNSILNNAKYSADNTDEWEILILLYGDCTSTFMVGSTVALAGIFLTGFPPFPDVLCINKLCFI